MKKLVGVVGVCVILSGCFSSYQVKYEDVAADGSGTSITIKETVGVGSIKISDGRAAASIGKDGDWKIDLGHAGETDSTPMLEIFSELIGKIPTTTP